MDSLEGNPGHPRPKPPFPPMLGLWGQPPTGNADPPPRGGGEAPIPLLAPPPSPRI